MYVPSWAIVDYLVAFLALYLVVLFILIFIFNKDKLSKYPKSTSWEPTISIVIPAYNEERHIGDCIESLLDSDYPNKKLEIIVVDDESTDQTYKVASKYKKYGVKVFRKKNEGTAASAKNYGIKRANGELIATLDADSYITKDTIRKMLPLFEDEEVVAVTSAIKVAKIKTFFEKLQKVEYVLIIFSRKILSFIDSVFVTPGAFSLFRASLFKKIGLFDKKNLIEDQEMALRIQKNNLKIRSSLDAEVFTNVPSGFFALVRQRVRWHRGGLLNSLKYFRLISPKYGDFGVAVMPLTFLALLGIFVIMFNVAFSVIFQLNVSQGFFLDNLALMFQPIHFIGIVLFLIAITFTFYQLSFFKKDNINPLWAIIYIICYAYLITLFWLLVLWKQATREEISW